MMDESMMEINREADKFVKKKLKNSQPANIDTIHEEEKDEQDEREETQQDQRKKKKVLRKNNLEQATVEDKQLTFATGPDQL